MAVKKTETEEVKKTPAKKVTAKTVKQKTKTTAKKVAPKVEETATKQNVDVVSEVLEIKAKNEEKKQAKAKVKTVKATVTEVAHPVDTKAQPAKTKREEVKENAQKAEAKKFIALKEESAAEGGSENKPRCELKNCAVTAWARAYKNMFNIKDRTSRYEFWSFILFNYIGLIVLVNIFSFLGFTLDNLSRLGKFVVAAFVIFQLTVHAALFVRRLHDGGNKALKGFFLPFIVFWALSIAATAGIGFVAPDLLDYTINPMSSEVITWFYIITSVVSLFYFIKTFMAASFFEEVEANEYGEPQYTDVCFKRKTLTMLSIVALIALFNVALYVYYMLLGVMYGGM